jgi:hypothetical protein
MSPKRAWQGNKLFKDRLREERERWNTLSPEEKKAEFLMGVYQYFLWKIPCVMPTDEEVAAMARKRAAKEAEVTQEEIESAAMDGWMEG